ncbi:glycosyltransferase family 2 protein [Phreatobacter stygius]|uniref:Glycosyltransferase n=1 Tax=Phreatobacter stygius TaxID=1940610 RepID=A0A4D7B9N5_9HYPH|nr:glycosyltransferase [Phreatobacter stygius]QCI66236.1 glycosyltransferase [Phreatobacter stygius]
MSASSRASFSGISGQATLAPADLLALVRDAFRRADYRTAWLLSDKLARSGGGADPLPFVLRASALARLGRAELSQRDLERAAFIDPFDRLTNDAIVASGEPAQRNKAFRRSIDAADRAPPGAVLNGLARLGKSILVRCDADDSGFSISGLSHHPVSVSLIGRSEQAEFALELQVDEPAHDQHSFSGVQHVPWRGEQAAVSLSCGNDLVFVHPPTVHRPNTATFRTRPSDAAPGPSDPGLLVVVPVYDDFEATRACFESLLANLPVADPVRIIAVDDTTPDRRIADLLDDLAGSGRIELIRNVINLGFAASVNRALDARRASEDVLLLNADTIVPPRAIARLRDIAEANARIGTVTPLSNNGEDTSVPCRFRSSPLGSNADVARLNELAWQANRRATITMPNGVGFCMLISARLLAHQPELPTAFGRGYFEDVAYCLAAQRLGFDNVCAAGVYVGHSGSRSFLDDKRSLVRRNLDRLKQQFPDYEAATDRFFRTDPLARFAARLEEAWLRQRSPFTLVLSSAEPDRQITALVTAGLGRAAADVVFARLEASADGPLLSIRGADRHMPQNLAVPIASDHADPLARLLFERAASTLVIDPHRLPPVAMELIRRTAGDKAALFLSHASDTTLPAAWADRFSRRYVTTGRLAAHFQRIGVDVALIGDPSRHAPAPRRVARTDMLYVLTEPAGEPVENLVRTIGGRLAAMTGAAPFTIAVLAEPRPERADQHVAWSGPMERAELPDWLALAGQGPCLFASRRYGVSDERIDLWSAAGIPVAYFDPDIEQLGNDGSRLALPAGMTDGDAAAALIRWMAGLAHPTGALGLVRRQQADRVENGV